MATIGELIININADTAAFVTQLEKVKDVSFDTATQVQRSFSLIGTAALGMVSVAAGAMAEGIAKTAEWEEHILHLAQASGTSVEQLSGLAAAANMMGVSVDEVAKAMERFDKQLVQAQAGNSKATQNLSLLGIDPSQIKSSDDALLQLADHFSKLPDGVVKTGEAMAAFGKSGAAMIPILNLGSQGMQDFIDQAKSMGLVITKDQAEAAERFEQNVKRMQESLHGLMVEITNVALPAMNALIASFQDTSKTQGFWKALAEAVDAVTGSFSNSGASLIAYMAKGDAVIASQEKMRSSVTALTANVVGNQKAVDALKKSVESIITTYQTNIATMGQTNLQVQEYKLRADSAKLGISDWVEQELRLVDALDKKKRWLEQLAVLDNSKIDEEKKNFLEDKLRIDQQDLDLLKQKVDLSLQQGAPALSAGALGTPAGPNDQFTQALDELTTSLEHQIAVFGMSTDEVTRFNLGLLDSSAAAKAMTEDVVALQDKLKHMEDVNAAWTEFRNVSVKAFDDLIFSGKSLGQVFQDLLKQLAEFAIKWALLGSPSDKGNGGLFGAIFSGLKGLFGFAEGGGVSAGKSIIVGEDGPEIFTPSVTGAIIPNSSIGASRGGATVNYYIDARGSSITEEQFKRSLAASEQRAVQRSLNATRELNLRTGS